VAYLTTATLAYPRNNRTYTQVVSTPNYSNSRFYNFSNDESEQITPYSRVVYSNTTQSWNIINDHNFYNNETNFHKILFVEDATRDILRNILNQNKYLNSYFEESFPIIKNKDDLYHKLIDIKESDNQLFFITNLEFMSQFAKEMAIMFKTNYKEKTPQLDKKDIELEKKLTKNFINFVNIINENFNIEKIEDIFHEIQYSFFLYLARIAKNLSNEINDISDTKTLVLIRIKLALFREIIENFDHINFIKGIEKLLETKYKTKKNEIKMLCYSLDRISTTYKNENLKIERKLAKKLKEYSFFNFKLSNANIEEVLNKEYEE